MGSERRGRKAAGHMGRPVIYILDIRSRKNKYVVIWGYGYIFFFFFFKGYGRYAHRAAPRRSGFFINRLHMRPTIPTIPLTFISEPILKVSGHLLSFGVYMGGGYAAHMTDIRGLTIWTA